MAKLINIGCILLLLLSCKKDKAHLSWGSEYGFLTGEWEWKKSVVSWSMTGVSAYSSPKEFVYSGQIDEWCALSFMGNQTLFITTESGNKTMKLTPLGVVSAGNNRIARFNNELGELITFTWSSALNQLETEYRFFSFPAHPCNSGFLILNSSYEKK